MKLPRAFKWIFLNFLFYKQNFLLCWSISRHLNLTRWNEWEQQPWMSVEKKRYRKEGMKFEMLMILKLQIKMQFLFPSFTRCFNIAVVRSLSDIISHVKPFKVSSWRVNKARKLKKKERMEEMKYKGWKLFKLFKITQIFKFNKSLKKNV